MLKCEICYDWCERLKVTEQWWDLVKNDWDSLKGTDLPCYVAILAVLRETTIEIFDGTETCRATRNNHSVMNADREGYKLAMNKKCEFVPLTKSQRKKWRGLYLSIRAFRNGAVHYLKVKPMNPTFERIRNPEDSFQNYYRYAPAPRLKNDLGNHSFTINELRKMHQFINPTILEIVRSESSNLDYARIVYEFLHVERGPFIELLNTKMTELLKETNVL